MSTANVATEIFMTQPNTLFYDRRKKFVSFFFLLLAAKVTLNC